MVFSLGYNIYLGIIFILIIISLIIASIIVNKRYYGLNKNLSLLLLIFMFILCTYIFVFAPLFSKIIINKDFIQINAPPYGKRIVKKDDITLYSITNYSKGSEYEPIIRLGGISVGKYKVGWFRLSNGEKALVAINNDNYIAFKTKDYYFLIGPKSFDEFINNLKYYQLIK